MHYYFYFYSKVLFATVFSYKFRILLVDIFNSFLQYKSTIILKMYSSLNDNEYYSRWEGVEVVEDWGEFLNLWGLLDKYFPEVSANFHSKRVTALFMNQKRVLLLLCKISSNASAFCGTASKSTIHQLAPFREYIYALIFSISRSRMTLSNFECDFVRNSFFTYRCKFEKYIFFELLITIYGL